MVLCLAPESICGGVKGVLNHVYLLVVTCRIINSKVEFAVLSRVRLVQMNFGLERFCSCTFCWCNIFCQWLSVSDAIDDEDLRDNRDPVLTYSVFLDFF